MHGCLILKAMIMCTLFIKRIFDSRHNTRMMQNTENKKLKILSFVGPKAKLKFCVLNDETFSPNFV
jgi:hypothetical protein